MRIASSKQIVAHHAEPRERALHCQTGGFENVYAINLESVRRANRPCHCAFADALGEHFAPFGFELFAVVQTANLPRRIEHHCRREHRAKQRAAPRFVQSGDGPVTGASRGALIAAAGHPATRRTQLDAFAQTGGFPFKTAQII